MNDIPVRPHRKTLRQTAIILNVSIRTVRRYLNAGKLEWSANQVSVESIRDYLESSSDGETFAEVEEKVQNATSKRRKQFSKGVE